MRCFVTRQHIISLLRPQEVVLASAELALVVERRAIAIGIACWSLLETLTSRTAYAA